MSASDRSGIRVCESAPATFRQRDLDSLYRPLGRIRRRLDRYVWRQLVIAVDVLKQAVALHAAVAGQQIGSKLLRLP
jgi:hypothetical protein